MRSFLQTQDWLDFQKHIGRKAWRFDDGKIKANIIQHDLPFGKNYLYIPHGPEISFDEISGGLRNELSQFVAYLKNLAHEQGSMFIKMEPLDDKIPEVLHDFKFEKSAKEVQPRKTVVLDLTKPEDELLAAMHHKTRYNIKISKGNDVRIEKSTDIKAFSKMLDETAIRNKFFPHSKKYYEQLLNFFSRDKACQAELILAYHTNNFFGVGNKEFPTAGAIILTCGDTCYYLHGASDHPTRAFMSPYGLHWGIIKMLKERGLKYYDLWGIDMQKYQGVTRFKLGWGGRQVEYPGSFDMPVSKFWYLIYNLARKIF